jgi:hypothetical protein
MGALPVAPVPAPAHVNENEVAWTAYLNALNPGKQPEMQQPGMQQSEMPPDMQQVMQQAHQMHINAQQVHQQQLLQLQQLQQLQQLRSALGHISTTGADSEWPRAAILC